MSGTSNGKGVGPQVSRSVVLLAVLVGILLLILENVHHADPATRRLIEALQDESDGSQGGQALGKIFYISISGGIKLEGLQLSDLDLEGLASRSLSHLSGGELRRVELAELEVGVGDEVQHLDLLVHGAGELGRGVGRGGLGRPGFVRRPGTDSPRLQP